MPPPPNERSPSWRAQAWSSDCSTTTPPRTTRVLAVVAASILAGATALNYAEAVDLCRDAGGEVTGAVVRDLAAGRTGEVRASVVVNATGVWVDTVRAMAGEGDERLRPSRGSHLLFPRHRLPLEVAVTGLSPDDGRPIFAVPHPEGTLIGTTDLFHDGPLDEPRPTEDEVAYLLRFAAAAFPAAGLRLEDICGAFAGVRPILDTGADDPSEVSREEAVWVERGLLSTAGGKLTTYRATATEVVDAALDLLPEARRAQARPASMATAALPWRATPAVVRAMVERWGASPAVAAGMTRRLGALAIPAAQSAPRRGLRPVADDLDLCAAELQWHAAWGGVVHLEDLLLRRARLGMWSPRRCLDLAPRLRATVRRAAGWSAVHWRRELERLHVAVGNWLPPEGT
jgi:glycerol-3-phosphate dehydrogenase